MNIRRVLAIAGIPFTIATCFVAPSQANAAHLSNQIAQISQNSPDDGPRRAEEEPRRPPSMRNPKDLMTNHRTSIEDPAHIKKSVLPNLLSTDQINPREIALSSDHT